MEWIAGTSGWPRVLHGVGLEGRGRRDPLRARSWCPDALRCAMAERSEPRPFSERVSGRSLAPSASDARAQDGTLSRRPARQALARLAGLLLALAPSLALCACASEPEAPAPLSQAELDEKAEVERLIALYRSQDLTWPAARDAALDQPRLAELLVQNFIRALVRAHEREKGGTAMVGSWSDFQRHQAQLVAMADASIPLLVVGLRSEDKVVVSLVRDTLSKIGPRAIPALTARFEQSTETWERREILATLAAMSGVEMVAIFERFVGAPEWQIRGEAYLALGRVASSFAGDEAARARVRALLQRGFSDPDVFVRRQAVKGLAEMGDAEALARLIERYRRSVELRLVEEERRELLQALRRATRLPSAVRPDEFEAWLQRRRANS